MMPERDRKFVVHNQYLRLKACSEEVGGNLEPDVDHFRVGRDGLRVRYADEERREHEHRCQVHGHHGLEVAGLK